VSAMLLFLAVIAAISGWWLSHQRLTAKPWLEEGTLDEFPGTGASTLPAAKIGLGVFLVVVGCLFALLISAYIIRIDIAALNIVDGARLPAPKLLWLNTGVLVLSSVALQWAWVEARRGQMGGVGVNLLAGAVSALAFVAGQLLVWRQLTQAGYFLASNPANAFFYLLTGVHGLHVLGGLVALGRTIARVWRGVAMEQVRQGVELCAIYWHFLLLVWLVVFSLVMGWADDFAGICRALIT
jgi:cytochrome c oxidase subunit III